MNYYETLMLLDAQASEADIATLEKQVKDMLKAGNGKLATFDKWGKYRLAYPVRKQEHGIYTLVRYEMEEAVATFLKKFDTHLRIKCPDLVMRHVHVRLEPEQFKAEYIKPESIEQAAQNESFNKRDGRGERPRGGMRAGADKPAAQAPVEAAPAAPAQEEEQPAPATVEESAEG